MFFTFEEVVRLSEYVARMPRHVSEELRGWRWSEPPLLHSSPVYLSFSDVTYGVCPTGRDVYLRRVAKVKPSQLPPEVEVGYLIHAVYSGAVVAARMLSLAGLQTGHDFLDSMRARFEEFIQGLYTSRQWSLTYDEVLKTAWPVWDHASVVFGGALERGRAKRLQGDSLASYVVPFHVEFPVEGYRIGLTQGYIDALLPPVIPVEIKVGAPAHWHRVELAAYALALEAVFNTPVDFGLLVYVQPSPFQYFHIVVPIGDGLRLEFIEARDRKARLVESGTDPGKAEKCSKQCPFYYYCEVAGAGRVGGAPLLPQRGFRLAEKRQEGGGGASPGGQHRSGGAGGGDKRQGPSQGG
ncbi:type I-A CRISPR-associated protein Cas4/Csa1 [Pyrobaculum aerophilum]|uniref:type I-A CRISPR-associated protein Cas4/Csa1 n=1 Tax=Pyrobaculum aerophilum TaxID=13773 RepID=UPI002FDB771F